MEHPAWNVDTDVESYGGGGGKGLTLILTHQVSLKLIIFLGTRLTRPFLHCYSGRGKFMPLPLKSKVFETPGSLVTDDIKMFPL
jgi:hypothetical protein